FDLSLVLIGVHSWKKSTNSVRAFSLVKTVRLKRFWRSLFISPQALPGLSGRSGKGAGQEG
ncbi:MAG: hypothetical protein QME74_05495, partial [Candidatus Edwardsbacteria bacterium]|nr:hypothetical protein [Candidatus Edwardsbacteria bacterium]